MEDILFRRWRQRWYEHLAVLLHQSTPKHVKVRFVASHGPVEFHFLVDRLRVDFENHVLGSEYIKVGLLLDAAFDNRAFELLAEFHDGALLFVAHVNLDVPVLIQ